MVPSVRSEHLDALLKKSLVQRVRVVSLLSYQTLGLLFQKAACESRLNKGDLVRRSTLSVWTAKGEEPSENAMTFVPLPRLVFPTPSPLFWLQQTFRLCSIPRGLSPALFKVFGQDFEYR